VLHADGTLLFDHPEPLQKRMMLDLALRSCTEYDSLGEVGSDRYFAATRLLRDRGD
jgi:hypothetical protein